MGSKRSVGFFASPCKNSKFTKTMTIKKSFHFGPLDPKAPTQWSVPPIFGGFGGFGTPSSSATPPSTPSTTIARRFSTKDPKDDWRLKCACHHCKYDSLRTRGHAEAEPTWDVDFCFACNYMGKTQEHPMGAIWEPNRFWICSLTALLVAYILSVLYK